MNKKRVDQPPLWFTLKNYDVCESFTPAQWLRALNVRRVLQKRLDNKEDFLDNIHIKSVGAAIKFCSIEVAYTATKATPGELFDLYQPAVRPYRDLELDNIELFRLHIDLRAPDSVLEEDFKSFVKEQREKKGISPSKALTENVAKKLHAHRVLPYLDLKLWNDHLHQWMTSEIYGDILFPNRAEIGSKSKVDQSTKDWIEKIYSDLSSLDLWFNRN